MNDRPHYTRTDWLWIAAASLTLVPFTVVRFLGFGVGAPFIVASVMGLAIVAASFFLSWAVEAMETVMPQALALAILALIEVAPEYSFEAILAFRQQTDLAAASMTGANRLLLGLGWPLILFVAYLSARRRGQRYAEIELNEHQAVPLLYLLIASLYAFVIVMKAALSWVDAVVLVGIYGLYIVTALRSHRTAPGDEEDEENAETGIAARTKLLSPARRWIATGCFLAMGAFLLYFGAEPFIDAVLQVARKLGVQQFVLIQWLAPFLSEFPESLTAYLWAAMVVAAPMGMANLISSKLNQWTLLIATIPIAYSLGGGHVQTMHLTAEVRDEIFLTAAQSLFGTVLVLTMRFDMKKAWALFILFLIQFLVPVESVRVVLAWIYVFLAGVALFRERRDLRMLTYIRRQLFFNGSRGSEE